MGGVAGGRYDGGAQRGNAMGEAANGSPKRFIVKLIKRDPATARYRDLALTPVQDAEDEHLEMFEHSDAAKAAVAKARAEAKAKSEKRVAAAE